MCTEDVGLKASLVFIAAMTLLLFVGPVAAKYSDVTVERRVSSQGLDLRQPADAQKFYRRLEEAARAVCTHGDRVDLEPLDDPKACYEKVLAEAVRAAHAPLLTQIYVANHTPRGETGLAYMPVPKASK